MPSLVEHIRSVGSQPNHLDPSTLNRIWSFQDTLKTDILLTWTGQFSLTPLKYLSSTPESWGKFATYEAVSAPSGVWKLLIRSAVAVPLGYVSLYFSIMIWAQIQIDLLRKQVHVAQLPASSYSTSTWAKITHHIWENVALVSNPKPYTKQTGPSSSFILKILEKQSES